MPARLAIRLSLSHGLQETSEHQVRESCQHKALEISGPVCAGNTTSQPAAHTSRTNIHANAPCIQSTARALKTGPTTPNKFTGAAIDKNDPMPLNTLNPKLPYAIKSTNESPNKPGLQVAMLRRPLQRGHPLHMKAYMSSCASEHHNGVFPFGIGFRV